MGTLIGTPQSRVSFQQQLFPSGLDLENCEIRRCLGTWRASTAASFRAGAPVMLDSTGQVVLSNGTAVLGVAKWSKVTLGQTLVVDQSVTFGVASATKNLLPNIVSGSVRVATAVQGGGTVYALTTDYTVSLVAGTITQVPSGSGGSIVPTAPVYVTYSRSLTASDYQLEGQNFWQTLDYVTIQDLRVAVIEAPAQVFTTEYDTAQVYTTTGATSNIYVNSSGQFTSVIGSNKLCGKVIQVPTASYMFLGIDFDRTVVANS